MCGADCRAAAPALFVDPITHALVKVTGQTVTSAPLSSLTGVTGSVKCPGSAGVDRSGNSTTGACAVYPLSVGKTSFSGVYGAGPAAAVGTGSRRTMTGAPEVSGRAHSDHFAA